MSSLVFCEGFVVGVGSGGGFETGSGSVALILPIKNHRLGQVLWLMPVIPGTLRGQGRLIT